MGLRWPSLWRVGILRRRFLFLDNEPVFLTQCVKMVKCPREFSPAQMDVNGNNYYQAMEAIGLLAWRGADESDSEFADEMAYGDRTPWTARNAMCGGDGDTNSSAMRSKCWRTTNTSTISNDQLTGASPDSGRFECLCRLSIGN